MWLPRAPHLDLVILVCTWDYPGSGDCGPHLGFTWILVLRSPSRPHLALFTMVINWAKLGPGYSVPQLDLTWTK